MIQLKSFFNFLEKKKISFFTGVPDSILKEFSIYINKNKINHILATNEGSAVALANDIICLKYLQYICKILD